MNQLLIEALASAGTFLFLWAVLGNLVFKPFLALVEEREARTLGDEEAAIEKRQAAKGIQTEIDEKLRAARTEGIALRDERVQQAKQEAQAILDRATELASQELKKAELSIAEVKQKALSDLSAEAEKLSHLVVERALATEQANTIH